MSTGYFIGILPNIYHNYTNTQVINKQTCLMTEHSTWGPMTLFPGLCVTRSSEHTLLLANRSSWTIHHVTFIAQQFHSRIQETVNRNWLRTKSYMLYPSLCCLYEASGEPKMTIFWSARIHSPIHRQVVEFRRAGSARERIYTTFCPGLSVRR